MTAVAPRTTERAFQAGVIEYARLCGWRVYHTHDSRRSEPGFPDLVMVRDRRIVFAELKTERGRLSAAQNAWLDELASAACPDHVSAFVWRPRDWDDIQRVLSRHQTAPPPPTKEAHP